MHSSRHKSSSGRHRTSGAISSSGSGFPFSFLFAISEVEIQTSETDTWGNARAPTSPESYDQRNDLETLVLLYHDGEIFDVSRRYYWWRDDTGAGAIYAFTDRHAPPFQATTYNQATICSGHPLLPFSMVKTDATFEETQVFSDGEGIDCLTWEPLRFFFPLGSDGRITGVSQAVFSCSLGQDAPGGLPRTYVAGRNPSWLRSLVPATYENHSAGAPASRGLGGDLAILLGLMAFTAPLANGISRARTVFLPPYARWRNRRWYGDRSYTSCK